MAAVGCAFWVARWSALFRSSADGTSRGWCKAVLPALMLADLGLYVLIGRDGPDDPVGQSSSQDPEWLLIVNFMAAFAVWCVLVVLDVPVAALARHRRGRGRSPHEARQAGAAARD